MLTNSLWITKLRNILVGIFLILFAQLTLPIFFEWKFNQNFWYIVIAVVFYFVIVDMEEPRKLARNAFFLILSFGTVIALIRPVQYALDEESHLANAIGISDSFLFKYSDEQLKDYDSVFLHDSIRNPQNFKGDDYWYNVEHQKSKIAGTPTSFDNPSFIPGAIGWNIGRLVSNKVYISYYIGRIFHVLAYALLVFLAIRISRVYQNMIYLMGTLPSALYVVSGYHYDYLYYGASLLMIAMLTNVLAEKEKITLKYSCLFQGLAMLLVFSKFPFVLMGSLLAVLPNKYFVSKKVKLFAIFSFIPVLFLGLVYTGILNIFNFSTSVTGKSPGLAYFLLHPLPIIRTMVNAPTAILNNFVSRPLQYVSHEPMFLAVISMLIFICLYIWNSIEFQIRVPKKLRLYLVFLFIGISFLMVYAITGDPRVYKPGDVLVGGIQGRYYYLMVCFLPILLPVILPKGVINRELVDTDNFSKIQQLLISFLTILTVSIGFYIQI